MFKNELYQPGLKGTETVKHEERALQIGSTTTDRKQLRKLFSCKHGLLPTELEG